MFCFTDSEIRDIVKNNDFPEFLNDVALNGELSEEDKRFIGYYSLCSPFQKSFNEVQRFEYINQLNTALILRNSVPVYSFILVT